MIHARLTPEEAKAFIKEGRCGVMTPQEHRIYEDFIEVVDALPPHVFVAHMDYVWSWLIAEQKRRGAMPRVDIDWGD